MPLYSFNETLDYFSEKLRAHPPTQDRESGVVELVVDQYRVLLSKGVIEGSLNMEITLGLMLHSIQESHLLELANSNFLGIHTGGCTFALDSSGKVLRLQVHVTTGDSPDECWQWLHRLLYVATEWHKTLIHWEEFVPLNV